MNIRPYHDADETAVVSLWRRTLGYDSPHNEPLPAIRLKQSAGDGLFFVAVGEDKNIVGTVMGGFDGHRGWIYSLAVEPAARRRGIGAALVRHVEQELLARGCPKINLQIHAHNDAVVAFYEKLGWRREPRISMGKILIV